ncbi:matrix-remodeling-associated protein 7 isoform X1 [Pleuronectes platessa]|uniref:matrix-remodeling-associated protein 7 isoform X1 n=1 Tax=Pleuronectes platessa TaxID=8262 RepID=UPI00232A127D|nr:matrix-remodeling-associated protein 7 isoform X1 [Pleuronectes platessa]
MDLTFLLSAIIFTLLAVVVGTSLFGGSSPVADFANARAYFGHRGEGATGGPEPPGPKQNGHAPEKKKQKKAEEDWCEISGSSHDHWDVVKCVESEQAHPQLLVEELEPAEHSSSTRSSLSTPRPDSRNTSLDVDSSSEASWGRRSYIGLSEKELLKCAFSYPQTEGATESPGTNDKMESNDSLKYIPGKSRSHHLQKMMSTEELEEEQKVQREQLAAIFHLLKDNQETFGEVSEGDMEDQLRLYSI